MANLSITSRCNRTCDYCFARSPLERLTDGTADMPLELFAKSLDFLERSGINQVRLLGGEPTLHAHFNAMVDQALARGLRAMVFSNGLMSETVLDYLAQADPEQITILVNAVASDAEAPGEAAQQRQCLTRLGERAMLGVNIQSPAFTGGWLLELIEEYGLIPRLRLGLAHPCRDGANRFLHPCHYRRTGRELARLSEAARQRGVYLEFDCGVVPCMFPDGALPGLGDAAIEIGQRCGPILDILPNGRVVSCYALADESDSPVFLAPEHDAEQLRAQFRERQAEWRELGIFRHCSACGFRSAGQCTGGCLAAARRRARHEPFSVNPVTGPKISAVSAAGEGHGMRSPGGVAPTWVIPYIDQPVPFWRELREAFGGHILKLYFPLPVEIIASGRPEQPAHYLPELLRASLFSCSALVNAASLPGPAAEAGTPVVVELRRLMGEIGLTEATVANLELARHIRERLPELSLSGSVLLEVATPSQAREAAAVFDTLVPASAIVRDLAALTALRRAFPGELRLMVNEGCLPACAERRRHFHEMTTEKHPPSRCAEFLEREPWRRLTGAWILPQHLHLYDGVYDSLKLAGRATLHNPQHYRRVLDAYVWGRHLTPDAIGGGPASVLAPLEIDEDFFKATLECRHRCTECERCKEYFDQQCRALRDTGCPPL